MTSVLPVLVIVIICSVSFQSTENLKLSAIKRIGSIVRSFKTVGATSSVCAVSFKYAVVLSITRRISFAPRDKVTSWLAPSQRTVPPISSTIARTGSNVLLFCKIGAVPLPKSISFSTPFTNICGLSICNKMDKSCVSSAAKTAKHEKHRIRLNIIHNILFINDTPFIFSLSRLCSAAIFYIGVCKVLTERAQ